MDDKALFSLLSKLISLMEFDPLRQCGARKDWCFELSFRQTEQKSQCHVKSQKSCQDDFDWPVKMISAQCIKTTATPVLL